MQKHEVSQFLGQLALALQMRYNSTMGKRGKEYKPRSIDRAVFNILAAVLVLSGGYIVGPWYLTEDGQTSAPLYTLFENRSVVIVFGTLLLICGFSLFWSAWAKGGTRFYTSVVQYTLLSAFLLRLYSIIGVAFALDSWRPPGYLSQGAVVLILGSYWVWVKVNVRLAE